MLQGYNFDHHDRLDGQTKRIRVIAESLPDALQFVKQQCGLLQAQWPITPPYDVSDFDFVGAEPENRHWIQAGHIEDTPNSDLRKYELADTAPDFERALWAVVRQLADLYDDEHIVHEWQAGVNAAGKVHRAGVALSVWYTAHRRTIKNDEFHYAGYYTRQDSTAVEKFLAVLKVLEYDDGHRATNFPEVRDQLDDPTWLGPYFFLQRIIPLLNERGITQQVNDILAALSPWLNQNQVLWFTDYAEDPGFVALYATDMDAQLKSPERVMVLPWYTAVAALHLFLPAELCEHIRRNGEGRNPFMAVLVPYPALADNLGISL